MICLPLIEGSTVSTKYGMVKTDHILFIASGAFHLSRPSDLIPELQGRLPIRVELDALTPGDFKRILTEPSASLTKQYQALLATEGLDLEFTPDGIERIAEISWQVNEGTENIGARRLHTVLERLLEEASFKGGDMDSPLVIDAGLRQCPARRAGGRRRPVALYSLSVTIGIATGSLLALRAGCFCYLS